jgi:hypothetical protein
MSDSITVSAMKVRIFESMTPIHGDLFTTEAENGDESLSLFANDLLIPIFFCKHDFSPQRYGTSRPSYSGHTGGSKPR